MLKSQRGSLLIGVLFLIIVIGAIVGIIANIAVVNSQSTADKLDTTQAFYDAESARAKATYYLLTSNVAQRQTCSQIPTAVGTGTVTSDTTTYGTYQITSATAYPSGSVGTLTSNIDNTTTPAYIPLSGNLSSYAPTGRVMIDTEMFDYGGKSTAAADCGNTPPCLTSISRARAGTNMAFHYIGAPVSQSQCQLIAQGSVPNTSAPTGQRQILFNILNTGASGNGWATSATLTGNYLGTYNGSTWTWASVAGVTSAALNQMEVLSYANAWTVGKDGSNNYLALNWNGTSWSRVNGPVVAGSSELKSVSCVDSAHCWFVGNPKLLFQYTGGASLTNAATDSSISSLPSDVSFNSVSCVNVSSTNTNYCWAVGSEGSSTPLFLYWNGSVWSKATAGQIASYPSDILHSVDCATSSSSTYMCSTVGGDANMNNPPAMGLYNSSTGQWTNYSFPTKGYLLGVQCLDSDQCYAVGQYPGPYGLLTNFNGSGWSAASGGTPSNATIYDIQCTEPDAGESYKCWMVGTGGIVWYNDGGSWTVFNSGTNNTLSSIGIVMYSTPIVTSMSWQETS